MLYNNNALRNEAALELDAIRAPTVSADGCGKCGANSQQLASGIDEDGYLEIRCLLCGCAAYSKPPDNRLDGYARMDASERRQADNAAKAILARAGMNSRGIIAPPKRRGVRATQFSPEAERAIAERWAEGETQRALQLELGVGQRTIERIVKESGLTRKRNHSKLSPAQVSAIQARYDNGDSLASIARDYLGYASDTTIRSAAKRQNAYAV